MADHQELIVTHFFRMVYLRTTSFCFILVIHFLRMVFLSILHSYIGKYSSCWCQSQNLFKLLTLFKYTFLI